MRLDKWDDLYGKTLYSRMPVHTSIYTITRTVSYKVIKIQGRNSNIQCYAKNVFIHNTTNADKLPDCKFYASRGCLFRTYKEEGHEKNIEISTINFLRYPTVAINKIRIETLFGADIRKWPKIALLLRFYSYMRNTSSSDPRLFSLLVGSTCFECSTNEFLDILTKCRENETVKNKYIGIPSNEKVIRGIFKI